MAGKGLQKRLRSGCLAVILAVLAVSLGRLRLSSLPIGKPLAVATEVVKESRSVFDGAGRSDNFSTGVAQSSPTPSCARTCRTRPNMIVLDHFGAAGFRYVTFPKRVSRPTI